MTPAAPDVDGILHGTPSGYVAGCRGIGCPNHGTDLMTCRQANRRYHGDYTYRKLVDAGTPPLTPETFVSAPRTRQIPAPNATKPTKIGQPLTPQRVQRKTSKSATHAAAPKTPHAPQTAAERHPMPDKPKRARKQREPVHGTVYGFARGCQTVDGCPKTALGETSCTEAQHAYYADYRAKRKAGQGPPLKHGTATGYQMGCTDRKNCPSATAGGISCSDASLAAERSRRRRAGIGPAHRAQHGTRGGYRQLKCRSRTECPSVLAGGISCSEASSNYQRDLRIAKRKRERETEQATPDTNSRPEWSTVMLWIDEHSPELVGQNSPPE